ncbi:amino acid ABC transporter permease [Pseudovibrio denitrificans]|uniref:amino acid ABC transporter permease n=1 Tax=Pseudovibrio denitrificans TaxID=258256 RepID=UPI0039BED89F
MTLLVNLFSHAPSRRLAFFVVLAALLMAFDLSSVGQYLSTLLNLDVAPDTASVLAAFTISAVITADVVFVSKLPMKVQVPIYWAQLLALFLGFFYSFDLSFPFIIERLPILLYKGLFYTLFVSFASIIFASILAFVGALMRLSNSGPAYAISTFYVSFFRGTPLLLQVYLIYLGLPQLGITLDAIPSGILALSLSYGAYMTEIFRAGIQAVPREQSEAAAALGLQPWQTMWKVVLPQAIRIIIPPTGNNFISMLKDSSLVSAMGIMELMYLARTLGRSEFKHFEMLISAALIYWAVSFVFEMIQARLEKRFATSQKRVG